MSDFSPVKATLHRAVDEGIAPGFALAVGRRQQPLFTQVCGHAALVPLPEPLRAETLFDLASLTKVLATTTLLALCVQEGLLDLDRPLAQYRPDLYPEDKRDLTLRLLMAHAAGLPAHVPFYRDFPPQADDPGARRKEVFARVRHTPLEAPIRHRALYSDLGPILAGEWLEARSGRRLDRLFEERLAASLGLENTFFVYQTDPLPKARRPAAHFAPTEQCSWRGSMPRGQVHDENAFLLGGVAGHAGLFSTLADVERLARFLLDALAGESPLLQGKTLAEFTRPQHLVPGSSRALGWDTPSPGSSCGTLLSPRAFGHTGFTGTSLWIDPEEDLYVILLSNRVHPTRENQKIMAFRPLLHDLIVQSLKETRPPI